jgi:hypothetical protein
MNAPIVKFQAYKELGYLYGRRQSQDPIPVAGGRMDLLDQVAEGWSEATKELIASRYLIIPTSPREWM